ncbi:adenylate/guanylate cyclase domain-containing protein [Alphaproteobacteria bacterium]|nr:adenylate/guanylate cyclase domain-containing protein [Alphaproteobacteria bacterium]
MKTGIYTKLRIWSGMILYIFVTLHLFNHALGLISIDAMEIARGYFITIWRNPVGTSLLYFSLLTHFILVLITLAKRKTLKMKFSEAIQTIFALIFPIGLILHALGTRGAHEIFGFDDNYQYELYTLWVDSIALGIGNSILIVLVWVHGTLGLYFWIRYKPWFTRLVGWLFSFVIILPIVAFLGFVNGGRSIQYQYDNGLYSPPKIPQEAIDTMFKYILLSWAIYLSLILSVFIYRVINWFLNKRKKLIYISYPNGHKIGVELGTSVLEASRVSNFPHASVCGGKGRCSTCRVRVSYGREFLNNPSKEETKVLERVGANQNTRLACQLTPTHDLTVTPLLPPDTSINSSKEKPQYYNGAEQEITILFADIRSFTKISEKKLPYDVVFILNQYFKTMGEAVEIAGGTVDKFIGDGVMALFGINKSSEEGCLQAIKAAKNMSEGIDDLNIHLKNDLDRPIEIGIGIHIGNVIIGDMGDKNTRSLTAIGDAVNTASRLENLNKNFKSQLLVSEEVVNKSKVTFINYNLQEIDIPGKTKKLKVYIFEKASSISII